MPDLSPDCIRYLREIDHRLSYIITQFERSSPVGLLAEVAQLAREIAHKSQLEIDLDCIEIIRAIEPRIGFATMAPTYEARDHLIAAQRILRELTELD